MSDPQQLIFWGVIASPFQLKVQALANHANVPWQRWPDQATLRQAFTTFRRLQSAQKSASVKKYTGRDAELDEYPAVPYYSFDGSSFYYDSSALAEHLDSLATTPTPLLPASPQLDFVCHLIDEAFDEFGLYMVHHNRWVTSAATNQMGRMTSREFRKLLPPGVRRIMAKRLPHRQVRRCPYLFSVAPAGLDLGVSPQLTPPSREGFPPTHQLLDNAWRQYLAAMENILQQQPFLLGHQFTLADASAYGQLSMNLVDGRAAELIEELAPLTFRWLCNIRDGRQAGSDGKLTLNSDLAPLMAAISETFVPLMQQNDAAYRSLSQKRDLTPFNEEAFDRGESLYDGVLQGHPFRAVVKTFQVAVWRDLCEVWKALSSEDRAALEKLFPGLHDGNFSL